MRGPGANIILVSFARRFGDRALAARRAALGDIDAMINKLIATRRGSDVSRHDVLSWLLEARDIGAADGADGGGMTDQDVRDEVLTLLLAGHETSTNALSWAYHLLAGNPDVADTLHAELDSVLDGGRLPGVDDLARLPYARAVVDESMRLYPPAWILVRHAAADASLAGFDVPAGTTILMSPFVVHRDPALWRDATVFEPVRWLSASGGSYVGAPETRHAYFPFGGGPRMCIGNTFALMEIALVLAHTSRHWAMAPVPSHRVGMTPRVTLRPRGGMPMVIHSRASGVRVTATVRRPAARAPESPTEPAPA